MKFVIALLIILSFHSLSAELWLPCPAANSGHYEFSAGLHFWKDHLYLRNLQLRSLYHIAPGIRVNTILRSNDEINQVEFSKDSSPIFNKFKPVIDESYLELFGFWNEKEHQIATSLKLGISRYLRFPYYGLISRMDQVAGMADIRSDHTEAGYRGALLNLDYKAGFAGFHNTLYYDINSGTGHSLEYFFLLEYENNWFVAEARTGRLIIREHKSDNILTESGYGYNLMAGLKFNGYDICLLWEEVDGVKYTGLSIKFASSIFTRFAGKVRLDYNRACEGFVFQYPVIYNDFGFEEIDEIKGMKKVGEIKAERAITFWRIGMQRNFYEHMISKWGITNSQKTKVVVKTEPMLLGIESIVSPVCKFSSINDLKSWDSNGIRPGQLTQKVTYEFYQ